MYPQPCASCYARLHTYLRSGVGVTRPLIIKDALAELRSLRVIPWHAQHRRRQTGRCLHKDALVTRKEQRVEARCIESYFDDAREGGKMTDDGCGGGVDNNHAEGWLS
jgi:hypothetical protein